MKLIISYTRYWQSGHIMIRLHAIKAVHMPWSMSNPTTPPAKIHPIEDIANVPHQQSSKDSLSAALWSLETSSQS
jgi:hypothetical protein